MHTIKMLTVLTANTHFNQTKMDVPLFFGFQPLQNKFRSTFEDIDKIDFKTSPLSS